MFYVTWARRPGSAAYPQSDGLDLQNAAYMQRCLDYYSATLAHQIQASTIMVGDYWAMAEGMDRSLNLYQADNSHPNTAGTYLTSLLFFRLFTTLNPDQVAYAPQDLSPKTAAELRTVAGK